MKNVCIFYDHLEYFTAIWNNLWPFGIVFGHLFYFSHFGMFGLRKIWQPWTAFPCDNFSSEKVRFGAGKTSLSSFSSERR
jgi:hypothetical protein